jgi:hypothetical protein
VPSLIAFDTRGSAAIETDRAPKSRADHTDWVFPSQETPMNTNILK